MRAGGVAMLLAFGVAVACGGRSTSPAPDPSDEAAGNTASAGRGSSASAGGKPSMGGKPNAGGKASTGGSFSVAGTLSVDPGGGGTGMAGSPTCVCEPLEECPPGYYRETAPGNCCGTGPCQLNCRDVVCSDIDLDCRPGMHAATLPGACCPSCETDTPPPCEMARKLYTEFRAKTLAKYGAQGCSPQGCGLAGENNRCAVNCGTPVPAFALNVIEEELWLFAEATCTNCPLPTEPVCLPVPPLSCNVGECTFDVPG